jgi:hypothetical protein
MSFRNIRDFFAKLFNTKSRHDIFGDIIFITLLNTRSWINGIFE